MVVAVETLKSEQHVLHVCTTLDSFCRSKEAVHNSGATQGLKLLSPRPRRGRAFRRGLTEATVIFDFSGNRGSHRDREKMEERIRDARTRRKAECIIMAHKF